jgi:hypothetical protein
VHYVHVYTGASDGERTEILAVVGDGDVNEQMRVIVGEDTPDSGPVVQP